MRISGSLVAVSAFARRITARTRASSSLWRERLGHVIIGAGIQRAHFQIFVFARAQHDNGDVG